MNVSAKFEKLLKKQVKILLLVIVIITLLYYVSEHLSDKVYFPPNKRSLLCSFGEGRLGNQISAFASIFAFSHEYGYRHTILESQLEMLMHYFKPKHKLSVSVLDLDTECNDWLGRRIPCCETDDIKQCKEESWHLPWKTLQYKKDKFFDYSGIESDDKTTGQLINMGDFPNQIKHYHKHLPELRNIFTFRRKYQYYAQMHLLHAKEKIKSDKKKKSFEPVFVGVHVRRTDYANHLEVLYQVDQVDEAYFTRAMDFYQSKYNNSAIFIFVSDDMEWVRDTFQNRPDVALLGNEKVLPNDVKHPFSFSEDVGEDLALLANCNHTIMSFGTFGLWGAMLAGGNVVLPSQIMEVKEGIELNEAKILDPKKRMVHNVIPEK